MRHFLLVAICTILRHPPSTYGDRAKEDMLLSALASWNAHHDELPTLNGERLRIEVSCLCGRKMVPFRAAPL